VRDITFYGEKQKSMWPGTFPDTDHSFFWSGWAGEKVQQREVKKTEQR
jgi:hypothetical protein